MPVHRFPASTKVSLSLVLLILFLCILWIAGGASRGDVAGQIVVRATAWIVLLVAILFGERPVFDRLKPLSWFLSLALLLALIQLIPLPPAIWQTLPGRDVFVNAAIAGGQPQPWRPWSIVPGATMNAASSLIVPAVVLILVAGLGRRERLLLPGLVLGLIFASTLVGLLQLSGGSFDNPLVNDSLGQISGNFANRNHLALFLAFGCLLAPIWAFLDGREPRWRAPLAVGLVLLFSLTILASGSRAGLILGVLALGLGLLIVKRGVSQTLNRYPRWTSFALVAGVLAGTATLVAVSVSVDRAVSLDRIIADDAGQDMRSRGLPTVLAMIRTYFPLGSGMGGFDPLFRMHEPFELLKLTYFNHAHNDLLEIVLDAGLPGLALLLAALAWWSKASINAWRAGPDPRHALPKLGSAMLLLVVVASAFDYPARTPMIMAMIVMAGAWLVDLPHKRQASALPGNHQPIYPAGSLARPEVFAAHE